MNDNVYKSLLTNVFVFFLVAVPFPTQQQWLWLLCDEIYEGHSNTWPIGGAEFVSLLLHMTYIVLTYKIVVDLLFKVNCHINMFIMSINSVLWRLSIIKVIYGGGGWSHWRVVQVCFPYCSSYYPKFTSFLEFHTSKEEVGVWHFW